MCIAFWLLEAHPEYKLLLALNRDEFHSRPTLPAHRWTDQPQIIGGRDGKEGGTWLAISESGRLAFVTNYREPGKEKSGALSRGRLPTLFLECSLSPTDYLEGVAARAGDYNGFNLIVADTNTGEMAYLSNRPRGQPIVVKQVSPGLHCLSNANLDSPWPKALRGKEKIEALLSQFPDQVIPEDRLIAEVLTDSARAPISSLPKTGLSEAEEHAVSPIFVYRENPPYGTRSMAIVAVQKNGQTNFYEKYLEDGVWKDHNLSFSSTTTAENLRPEGQVQRNSSNGT